MTEILTNAEAAGVLRLGRSTLEKLRIRGDGPTFIKIGRRVLYHREDLNRWLEGQQRRRSTSETHATGA